MISAEKEREIRDLLAQNVSIRRIARQLRVGRNQIAQIARGARPNYVALRRMRNLKRAAEETTQQRSRERCPTCGARVFMPCLRCTVVTMPRKGKRDVDLPFAPLGLALKPDHEQRYLEVLARRQLRAAQAQASVLRKRKRWRHASFDE